MNSPKNVLIVGAGLAGLSAAIALSRGGAQVTLITHDVYGEGTSITITNRAVDAVEALGILDQCLAKGDAPSGSASIFASVMDGHGNPLPVPPPPPREDARLPAFIAIFRPDLGRILTDAAVAAGVVIRAGMTFDTLDPHDEGVDVQLSDGTVERFDLVVGADGAHSAVRRTTHPDIIPTYTGWMSFRIVLENGPPGPVGFYTLPTSDILATVRLPGNRLYLAAGLRMEHRRVSSEEAVELLDGVLAHYDAPLIAGIRARLRDRPPVVARPFEWLLAPAPWHRGRIVLIGDAAHATTPNLASGGSIALEDGVVLAEELARTDDIEQALQAFSRRRHDRAALVVLSSLRMMQLTDANADPRESAALRSAALAELMKPY